MEGTRLFYKNQLWEVKAKQRNGVFIFPVENDEIDFIEFIPIDDIKKAEKMTVKQLIEKLKGMDQDKVVILSDGQGWSNIESIKENFSDVTIIEERRT